MHKVQEGMEDSTEAVLINLDQSKAIDRVDHQFLATVLETQIQIGVQQID